MIRTAKVVLREIGLRLQQPFRSSGGIVDQRRILIVEIMDGDGATGWGECVAGETPYYSSEIVDTAWEAISGLVAPAVLSQSFASPVEAAASLLATSGDHPMATAAIEMAVWDLAAHRAGVPLAVALGGTRETVGTGVVLGINESASATAEAAAAAAAEGYRRVKLKIEPGADLLHVATARDAVGPDVSLAVDANGAYRHDHFELIGELDQFGLVMIEQPLPADDLAGHAALQARISTPLCLDESITSVVRLEEMVRLGAGMIVNLKPGKVGGHSAAKAIHDTASVHRIPVWCGGMLESGIGRAHNVALASLPGFTKPGDLSPSRRYWERDIVDPEWTMMNGALTVPLTEPGIGVTVNRKLVQKLTVRKAEFAR